MTARSFRHFFLLVLVVQLVACNASSQADGGKGKKPFIVFVTGDHEYSSEATLPLIAAELEKNYGFRTKVLKAFPDYNAEENIPGLEVLKEADVAVFFLRWRRLPAEQLKYIEDYLKKIGLIKRASTVSQLISIVNIFLNNEENCKAVEEKARKILNEMEDPVEKLVSYVASNE